MSDSQTKKFGKGERTIPHYSQKAQKWYPVDDESQPKKVSTTLATQKDGLRIVLSRIYGFALGSEVPCFASSEGKRSIAPINSEYL
jgi:hypothetical protein